MKNLTSADISLTLVNPKVTKNPKNILYQKSLNELQLIYKDNVGVGTISPGNELILNIPKNTIEDPRGTATVANQQDWTLQPIASTTNNYKFTLTPNKQINFQNNLLTITLKQLKGNKLNRPANNIVYSYKNFDDLHGGRTSLQVISNQKKDFTNHFTFSILYNQSLSENLIEGLKDQTDGVYISPTDQQGNLHPSVPNQLMFNILFGDPSGKIAYNEKAIITVTFAFGEQPDKDLTDALLPYAPNYNPLTSGWNIQAAIMPPSSTIPSNWVLTSPTPPDPPLPANPINPIELPCWKFTPKSGASCLFNTGNYVMLTINFSHIITKIKGQNASLTIKWEGIPDYKNGSTTRPISKQLYQNSINHI